MIGDLVTAVIETLGISEPLLHFSELAFDFRLVSRIGCFPDGWISLRPETDTARPPRSC
jgi:hypothetical protein